MKKESVPAGHFYSVIPSELDVNEFYKRFPETEIFGVNLNPENQILLLEKLKLYYPADFPDEKQKEYRYYFKNGLYSYTDGIILQCMIRYLKPHRIIEIGFGFSSAIMLDINQKYFNNTIELRFIDPYINRLKLLVSEQELNGLIILKKLQEIDLDIFNTLVENDILFIDSTHVSKINSDVNKIFFEILPKLNPGVIIHFHDIFWAFVYPENWVRNGRAWNETYILRAFLQYNDSFEIILFSDYIHKMTDWFAKNMPLTLNVTGGNIWLKKIK
jgi:predicted O-methyltransferase YrrM